jgi:uncharacterized membrane protein YfcA
MLDNWWILILTGIFSGLLAGLFGIGGGTIAVAILLSLGYTYAESVATSSLAIVFTALAGTIQNWRLGSLKWQKVILLGLPGIFTAFAGVYVVKFAPKYLLELAFGCFLLINIYLTNLKQNLAQKEQLSPVKFNPNLSRPFIGGLSGFLAGIFGIGGGAIMVPLQMIFLGEKIKIAIVTSLGVVLINSIASCIGHAYAGHILYLPGMILGIGGSIGVQFSTRFLPKLPDKLVHTTFCIFLILMAIYFFICAWHSYQLASFK